jgi:hypothetical protein
MKNCVHFLIAIANLTEAIRHIELFPNWVAREKAIKAIEEQIGVLEKEYQACI